MFIVTEVSHSLATGTKVRTFGPFISQQRAEAARRRMHFDNISQYVHSPQRPRTFITEVEAERAHQVVTVE